MRRHAFVLTFVVAVLGLAAASAPAQGAPPPPGATPGAVGTSALTLAVIDPAVAPGYRLAVVELTWEPGAYATRHSHPTALVTCVQEGALGFLLHEGAATLTRAGTAATPEAAQPLAPDAEVVLGPRDCIAFDEFASHMEHTGWNAGDGPLVLWEARLLKVGEPFTTYVNEQGTPVP